MTDFYFQTDDFSELSLDEGYAMWRRDEGQITAFGRYHARGNIIEGEHWTGRDIATGGMGNSGVRLIIPVSREARKLVRTHVTECWVNRHDISYRQADALYSCRVPYKFELIEDICAAINDEACHDAFMRFPGVGPGMHGDWLERWGDAVSPYCARSWPRNAALIKAVCHVIYLIRGVPMTRFIIALLLLSSIASAEQIRYRATASTSLDEWVGVDTRVDGRVEKALLLVDQQPDTITVDYTVDTTAAMWRIDLMAFAANTHLGFAWSGEPASDVEWVSTSSIIDMDGWQSQNLFRYLDIEGFVLHGSSIAFTDAPEPINPGVASFEPEPWLPEAPYHAWAAENEYTYAATIQQRKYQNRAFTGVQYTEFDPAVALGSSRRLRRNCRFAGLDFCGTDGLAMSAAIAAVPEPSSLSLVLAVVAFISLTTHPREGGDARSAGRRTGHERRHRRQRRSYNVPNQRAGGFSFADRAAAELQTVHRLVD